jgi:hypothetical protein
VELKICPRCERPFLASEANCPRCPQPPEYDADSWMNLGCLLATILPLFVIIFLWLAFAAGVFMR